MILRSAVATMMSGPITSIAYARSGRSSAVISVGCGSIFHTCTVSTRRRRQATYLDLAVPAGGHERTAKRLDPPHASDGVIVLRNHGRLVRVQVKAAGHLVGAARNHLGPVAGEDHVHHGALVVVLLPWLHRLRIRFVDAVDPRVRVPAARREHVRRGREGQRRDRVGGTRLHLYVLLARHLGGGRDAGRGGRRAATPPASTRGLEKRQLGQPRALVVPRWATVRRDAWAWWTRGVRANIFTTWREPASAAHVPCGQVGACDVHVMSYSFARR